MKTFTKLREFYHFINNAKEDLYIKGSKIYNSNNDLLAIFDWANKEN